MFEYKRNFAMPWLVPIIGTMLLGMFFPNPVYLAVIPITILFIFLDGEALVDRTAMINRINLYKFLKKNKVEYVPHPYSTLIDRYKIDDRWAVVEYKVPTRKFFVLECDGNSVLYELNLSVMEKIRNHRIRKLLYKAKNEN